MGGGIRMENKPKIMLNSTEDMNAFVILSKTRKALREAGQSDRIDTYTQEATNGDYENLLTVTEKYVEIIE